MVSSNTGTKDGSGTNFPDPKIESGTFVEGEKVLAYRGPCLEDAKGWKKSWDEWVEPERLLKYTEENLRLQKALQKKAVLEKPKSGRSTQSKPKTSTVGKSKGKVESAIEVDGRRRAIEIQEKALASTDKNVKIQIPPALRKQLLDDSDYVKKMGKLVKLPRSPCIDDILTKYLDHTSKKDGIIRDPIVGTLKGIRGYFDKAMSTMLLYNSEHQQYREAIVDDVSPSTVYGAEHLLRLFVKLPELLPHANIEEQTLKELLLILHDFLKFLQKNQGTFFSTTYDGSPSVEGSVNEVDN